MFFQVFYNTTGLSNDIVGATTTAVSTGTTKTRAELIISNIINNKKVIMHISAPKNGTEVVPKVAFKYFK